MRRLYNIQLWLFTVFVVAFVVRLVFASEQNQLTSYTGQGGDAQWYLQVGYRLVTGYDYSQVSIPTAPLYLVFVGVWQVIFGQDTAPTMIRVTQSLLGACICYFASRIANDLSDDERVGLMVAGILAISPAFVMESRQITTETLYIFLVTFGLSVYVRGVKGRGNSLNTLSAAALLGLAALTRAVLLLYPVGLALLQLFAVRTSLRWSRVRDSVLLMAIYVMVVSTWTIHNLVQWDRFVVGGEGFAAFLFIGATGWQSPLQVDETLSSETGNAVETLNTDERQEAFSQATAKIIGRDPLGYVARRMSELGAAYLQPHGTENLGGESIKNVVSAWWQYDRSLRGLLGIASAEYFWTKLAVYIFHYAGLLLGVFGMWLTRKSWRLTLPLIGFILYTTLVHLVFLAIPRYIFPTQVFWWIFASVTLVESADHLHQWRTKPDLSGSAAQATTEY